MKNKIVLLISFFLASTLFGCTHNPGLPISHTTTSENELLSSPDFYLTPESTNMQILGSYSNSVLSPPGLIVCGDNELLAFQPDGTGIKIALDCSAKISPNYKYAVHHDLNEFFVSNLYTGEIIYDFNFEDNDNWRKTAYEFEWSADSNGLYYCVGERSGSFDETFTSDIWHLNIQTGENINLTNTESIAENSPKVLNDSKKILFRSQEVNGDLGRYYLGFLAIMDFDGSNYKFLSDDRGSGLFEISPDGSYIATFGGAIYESETLSQINSPEIINGNPDIDYDLQVPSWSPNSNRIAWSMNINENFSKIPGFAIQEIEKNTVVLLYPFGNKSGVENFPIAPTWSPDSKWLVVRNYEDYTYIEDEITRYHPGDESLCIFNSDGIEEACLDNYYKATWDPDNKWIVLNQYIYPDPEGSVWITKFGEWELIRVYEPYHFIALEWLDSDIVEHWVNIDIRDNE